MTTPTPPYIKQSGAPTDRMCGAACLAMAYASFGQPVSQEEIWPAISKRNRSGSLASTTHLMAKDAIARGFDAVAIQASRPLQALQRCQQQGFRAILNHRLSNTTAAGHYSVLAGFENGSVLLHDPLEGPSRRATLDNLLDLWQPGAPGGSEIIGNVLIAIAPRLAGPAAESPKCPACKVVMPKEIACPACSYPVPLSPSSLLGCIGEGCRTRLWRYLCCPECDCTWAFNGKPAAQAGGPAAAQPKGLEVDHLYSELDKFFAHIKGIPGAADHADIQAQMSFIASQKEPLRAALAEAAANRRQRMQQMDDLTQTAEANKESLRKRREDAARQSPPLDGDALGMALLRNHGFVN